MASANPGRMQCVVKNARVVTSTQEYMANIGIRDGRFAAIVDVGTPLEGETVIDAEGRPRIADYPFWLVTSRSMQYSWGNNVGVQLIKERLVAFLYADRLGAPLCDEDYRSLEIASSALGSSLARLLLELRKAAVS